MDSHHYSLSFELKIIRGRNINVKSSRELFVRCYLPAGNNKRVRLESKQVSSNSNFIWNQTLSLNCLLDQQSFKSVKQGTIILELRSRNSSTSIFMRGSKLIGRAEMPWNEAKNMETEKWAVMMMTNKINHVYNDDVKPPAVQVAIKLEESAEVVIIRRNKVCERRWDDCGCAGECNSCVDYDYFLH